MDNEWTDCSRSNCCPSYTYVAGRCVPDDINPCSLNLCEQKCSVYFGRVVCTCFSGYKFNRQKHLLASSQQQQEDEQQQNAQNHQGLDILFSSNHNIQKSLCGLCWASDPLIERY